MRWREAALPALAATAALSVLAHDWIYSSLFFYLYEQWQIYGMVAAPFGFIALVTWAGAKISSEQPALRLVDTVSLLFLIAFAFMSLRQQGYLFGGLSVYSKLAWVVGSLWLAWWLPRRLSEDLRVRLRWAIVTFGVLFLVGPAAVSRLGLQVNLKLGSYFSDASPASNTNTLILILDELSASGAQPILQKLREHGHEAMAKELVSSGEHTISAIPALLIGTAFNKARTCAPSALCSSGGMFDFSRQVVARPKVNIVGFFHPYCEMKGLAFCAQHAVNGFPNILLGYACSMVAVFSGGHRFEVCEAPLLPIAQAELLRAEIRSQAQAAPFWKDGGTLYVHTMLPHPPGSVAGQALDADYAENLKKSADLAADLALQLETTFGQNFLLVITSDHPLRPTIWCGPHRYVERGCAESVRFQPLKVPLIAVGQGAKALMDLDSNLGLMNRLAQRR
jgi:hypothetical protein